MPVFNYNPDLFWDADPSHAKATIKAGPNNPVGVVWIGLDKDHFGFHGTPEPSQIGRTQSHGCVRMTNWDAEKLASLVTEGMPRETAMTRVRRHRGLVEMVLPWTISAIMLTLAWFTFQLPRAVDPRANQTSAGSAAPVTTPSAIAACNCGAATTGGAG